ncbi:MAG: hypothetical protein OEU54_08315 [Gemmatimonadota bacterium]|nr:hypothetical protein [Gemmatimonadota bacterium]
MYVLKRVALLMLVIVAAEGLLSLVWLMTHGTERGLLAETGGRIEGLRTELAVERDWLAGRAALGRDIDAGAERLRGGAGSFESAAVYEAARSAQAGRVSEWNSRIEEHERRASLADSLATVHDSLVSVYEEAHRRAYPGWVLLPRPELPGGEGGG